jgi:hypothetical protein
MGSGGTSGVWIRSRQTALILGAVLTVAGAACLYDACEHRGAPRPFALKFLPS